jgi:hypothetical protein
MFDPHSSDNRYHALLSISCELVLNFVFVSVKGTLVEDKMCTFTPESTRFVFNKCLIYTHDGANAKFGTNSHDADYSV